MILEGISCPLSREHAAEIVVTASKSIPTLICDQIELLIEVVDAAAVGVFELEGFRRDVSC